MQEHRPRIKAAGFEWQALNQLALKLGTHLGLLQPLTGTHLIQEFGMVRISLCRSCTGYGEADCAALNLCAQLCILALNMITEPPAWVPLDAICTLREVQHANWIFACCIVVGKVTGRALNPTPTRARIADMVMAWLPADIKNVWQAFVRCHPSRRYKMDLAASGG
ncbi:hypothetical protein PaG_01470 [Moesziomyces aphidis]|jgi:hypothetical protein|uniref:Uncharacterized protein n=1 Tax=Moesziomyces aphidis TaxID=84754 RepID=W3VRS6_MOEAP|nr:hypothetical protein PaG_01470 [Moesziomyces aphidis]